MSGCNMLFVKDTLSNIPMFPGKSKRRLDLVGARPVMSPGPKEQCMTLSVGF